MITDDELERIREIRKLVEDGRKDLVSHDQRQWILDIFKREGIEVPVAVYDGAAEAGLDIDGLEVKHD
jgi:hypothetical protein